MNKNKNYVRGRTFEYKISTLFRRKGYFVIRAAGSHGVADLVAVKKGRQPLFIQAKTGETGISKEERDKLYLTAVEADATAIVASKEARKPIVYTQLVGLSSQPDGGEVIVKECAF